MSILHNLLAKLYIPSTLNSYGRGLEKFPLELGAPACICGVIPNFKNTVVCGLKFHLYLRILCQKAMIKIEVFQFLPCLAWGPPA